MDIATTSGQIILQVQNAIIESPSESLLDKEWVIALIGALSSVFIIQSIDALRAYFKKRKILHGLLREITFLTEYYKQNLPILVDTLHDLENGKRTSLIHAEMGGGDNYNIYLNNFIFLEEHLDSDIYLFYRYLKLIDSGSLEFSNVSDMYRAKDPTIRVENIILMLENIIEKMKESHILGKKIITKLEKYL